MSYDVYWVKNRAEKIADFEHPTFWGGSIGAWLGMKAFHHKTMHKKFYIGVPTIIILQLAFAVWLAYKCLAA